MAYGVRSTAKEGEGDKETRMSERRSRDTTTSSPWSHSSALVTCRAIQSEVRATKSEDGGPSSDPGTRKQVVDVSPRVNKVLVR